MRESEDITVAEVDRYPDKVEASSVLEFCHMLINANKFVYRN